MSFSVVPAYLTQKLLDLDQMRGDFAALHSKVRSCPIGETIASPGAVNQVCASVDMACIWYWKEVLCLQRSAATAYLLKRRGVPAQLLIGAQQMPFKAHAWVEVNGRVVNDKPYMREIYKVLDKC